MGSCTRAEEPRRTAVDLLTPAPAPHQGAKRVPGAGNLVVTGTGFNPEEREALRHAVTQQLGGRYLPDLVHRTTAPHCHTTLLVCKTLLDAFGTAKYTRALEWGLPVVHWSWVRDSIQQQALQPLGPYKTDTLPTGAGAGASRKVFAELGNVQPSRRDLPSQDKQDQQSHSQRPAAQAQAQAPAMCLGSQSSLCSGAPSQLSLSYMLHQQQQSHHEGRAAPSAPCPPAGPCSCSPEFRLQPTALRPAAGGAAAGSDSAASTPGFATHVNKGAAGSYQAAPWPSAPTAPHPGSIGLSSSGQEATHGAGHGQSEAGEPQGFKGFTQPGLSGAQQQQQQQQQGRGVSMSPLPADFEISSPSFGSPIRRSRTPAPAAAADPDPDDAMTPGNMSRWQDGMGGGDDDIIIPGTQAIDDDDGVSSPQSLLAYLRTKMMISGMAQGTEAQGQRLDKAEGQLLNGPVQGCAPGAMEPPSLDSGAGWGMQPGGQQRAGWQQGQGQGVQHHLPGLSGSELAPLPTPTRAQGQGDAGGPDAMEVSPLPLSMCNRMDMDMGMDMSPAAPRHAPGSAGQGDAAAGQPDQASVLYSGFSCDIVNAAVCLQGRPQAACGAKDHTADAQSQVNGPAAAPPPPPPHGPLGPSAQHPVLAATAGSYPAAPAPPATAPAPAFVPPNGPLSSFIKAEPRLAPAPLGPVQGNMRAASAAGRERRQEAHCPARAVSASGWGGAEGVSSRGSGGGDPAANSGRSAAAGSTSSGATAAGSRAGSGPEPSSGAANGQTVLHAPGVTYMKPEPEGATVHAALGPVGGANQAADEEEEEDWLGSCDADEIPSFSLLPSAAVQQQQQQQQRQPLRRLQRGAQSAAARPHIMDAEPAGHAVCDMVSSVPPAAAAAAPRAAPSPSCTISESGSAGAAAGVRIKAEVSSSAATALPLAAASVAAKALASARAARNAAASAAKPARVSSVSSSASESAGPGPGSGSRSSGGVSQAAAHTQHTQHTPVELLQQMLQQAEAAGSGDRLDSTGTASDGVEVLVLKPLTRAPRGNGAREYHQLTTLKGVEFAEQVKVSPLGLTLTCKDRSKRTTCPLLALRAEGAAEVRAVLAEPYAVYCIGGDMWMEFHPMVSLQELRDRAAQGASGAPALQAPEMAQGHEVLRVLQRQHAKLSDVCGAFDVVRTKKLPSRLAPGTLYQRYTWDAETCQVLTDAPASDFVVGT